MLERCRFEQSFTKAAEKNLRYPALHGLRMHHSVCYQICYTLSASDGHHNRLLLPTHKNQCVLRTDWQTTSRLAVSTDFFSLHSIHPCELRTDWQTTSRLAVHHKSWLQVIKTSPDSPQGIQSASGQNGRGKLAVSCCYCPTQSASCASALSIGGSAHPCHCSVCL